MAPCLLPSCFEYILQNCKLKKAFYEISRSLTESCFFITCARFTLLLQKKKDYTESNICCVTPNTNHKYVILDHGRRQSGGEGGGVAILGISID